MICELCGCTDERACVDATTGERCAWSFAGPLKDLCTFCTEELRIRRAALEGEAEVDLVGAFESKPKSVLPSPRPKSRRPPSTCSPSTTRYTRR